MGLYVRTDILRSKHHCNRIMVHRTAQLHKLHPSASRSVHPWAICSFPSVGRDYCVVPQRSFRGEADGLSGVLRLPLLTDCGVARSGMLMVSSGVFAIPVKRSLFVIPPAANIQTSAKLPSWALASAPSGMLPSCWFGGDLYVLWISGCLSLVHSIQTTVPSL